MKWNAPETSPPQAGLLRWLLLPAQAEGDLLRAGLLQGEAARQAFSRWSAVPAEALARLQTKGGLMRRLLPLLQANVEREGLTAPPELQAPLRAAALYEQLRTQAYREIAAEVFSTLNRSRLPYLAMRGVVFSAVLYASHRRRHCHDIDLLLPPDDLEAATRLLTETCGFAHKEQGDLQGSGILLFHTSGLPLMLHAQPLLSPAFRPGWPMMWKGHVSVQAHGTDVPTPAPAQALLQVLLHGPFVPQGGSLMWLCDAFALLQQNDVDWTIFSESITGDADLLAVLLSLHYLSAELQAQVPVPVLQRLNGRWTALAETARYAAGEVLLLVLLQQGVVGRRTLWHTAHERGELLGVLRTMFAPSWLALQQTGKIHRRSEAPAHWLHEASAMLRRRVIRRSGSVQGAEGLAPAVAPPASGARNGPSLR